MIEREGASPVEIKEKRSALRELLNFPIIAAPLETGKNTTHIKSPKVEATSSDSQKPEATVVFEAQKEEFPSLGTFFSELLSEFVFDDYSSKSNSDIVQSQPIKKNKSRFKRWSSIEKAVKPGLMKLAEKLMDRTETNIGAPIKPQYAEGFNEAILEITKDPNNILVFTCNHEGLGDGAPSGIISKQVYEMINNQRGPDEEKFRGFMLTIASSLTSGHQGSLWQELIKLADKTLQKYYLYMIPYTREKDKIQYNLHADNDEYKKVLDAIIKKEPDRIADGLFLYIAGNMSEGRRIKREFPTNLFPFGRPINGLPDLNCDRFHALAKITELRYGKKFIIVPVGMFGGFNVFDPEHHSMPTPKAIKELVSNNPKSLFTVRVGLPISYDQIVLNAKNEAMKQKGSEDITSRDVDSQLGYMLARQLPKEAQGHYKINS